MTCSLHQPQRGACIGAGANRLPQLLVVALGLALAGPARGEPTPAPRGVPLDVIPGNDYWITPAAHVDFGSPDYPPIPPNFFGPGSEPFIGRVNFQGVPIDPGPFGQADTIIERTATALLPANGSVATIPIEVNQLHLQSTQPIIVNTQPYHVHIHVFPSQPSNGDMTITRLDFQGGIFEWDAMFQPVYVFVPAFGGPPQTLATHPPLFISSLAPAEWWYFPPEPPPPGSGPNFFPVVEMNMLHLGSYAQHLVPLWNEACCLPNGTCAQVNIGACLATGGTPQGPGSACLGDLDGDGVNDACARDCNSNGVEDHAEIAAGTARDLNSNGIPDDCDIAECRNSDLNHNGIIDEADIAAGTATDANGNGLIDEVEQPENQHSYISMQGGRLRDDDLAKQLKELLVNSNGTPNAKDVKLFFQECFGGGMLDDIARELGTAVPWVAGAASRHDEVSFGEKDDNANSNGPLDRWTRPLLGALDDLPVLQALKKAARDDAANPQNRPGQNERPQYRFSGDNARGITLKDPEASSHHAVILAGKPDAQRHRNDVRKMCELLKQEWGDLNTTGTSVHVLFGDGTQNPCANSGVPGGNVSPATNADLKSVLENLRASLNENEEFVLYVSDHGTGSVRATNDNRRAGGPDVFDYSLDIPDGFRYGLIRDPFNAGPTIEVHASGAYAPATVQVFLNGDSIGFLNPAALDPEGQNITVLPIREGAVVAGTSGLTIDATAAGGGVTIVSAEFQLNDINTIPVPGWGDSDGDGDVDLADQSAFATCMSGPGGGYLAPDCAFVDIDEDVDVDLFDALLFQSVFTGPL